MASLWGEEFTIAPTQEVAKKVISRVSKPKEVTVTKVTKSKTVSLEQKLQIIYQNVKQILGRYADRTLVIKTKEDFVNYIDKAISNGAIAIDTETNNSLEPITCKLMGPCIYTPGLKNAYIPINHTDMQGNRLEWQLTEEDVAEQFSRLRDTLIIMHNGKFDYQVIKCTTGVELKCYWDTMIGAKILDENERAGLKEQYISKIDSSIEKYSIDHLFEKIPYNVVDPEIFALYAATDSFMTYKLYQYQKQIFEKSENERLYSLFMNVEMPVVEVVAEMELQGVCIDKEYAKRLSAKYHRKAHSIDKKIEEELKKYSSKIAEWRLTPEANYTPTNKSGIGLGKSKSEQLKDPVEVTSPSQLAILLYDVLKIKPPSAKSPRGTGEDILLKIDLPLCKYILEKRGIDKLLGTYIDKLPECVCEKDNRLHAHFNQLGAGTGRLSSSSPNLQNIPSHEYAIRMMFTPGEGNVFCGGDFSQQEPRLLASYSNDERMINSYLEGKDLYANIASTIYHNKYEDNREFYPDGTVNDEGKKRRSNCKSVLLGIMYGRGAASIADQIKTHDGQATREDIKEAQSIVDNFFNGFPNVKKWIDKTESDAREFGYVEDLWGRRRRLPDIQKEPFDVISKTASSDFNPLLFSDTTYAPDSVNRVKYYKDKLSKTRSRREVDKIKEEAAKESIEIHDNGGYISQAQRQCVNARVQGGAASMSKVAMKLVYNDPELRRMGFRLCIAVHDELIGECPEEYGEEVQKRLSELMIEAGKPQCVVPMKCDTTTFKRWYQDEYAGAINKEYSDLTKKYTDEEAFDIICKNHEECFSYELKAMLKN